MYRLLSLAAFGIAATAPGLAADPAPVSPFARPFPVPETNPKNTQVKPFEYVDVGPKIPNYRRGSAQGTMSEQQKPLAPEESLKHVVVPKGFRAELFVTEKELGGKPICMTWDEKGRLWAALTIDYPNELKQPEQGRDRIVYCEDTNNDGRADKVTVFAEKLSIPTSLLVARGGVIAFDATQTVLFKDTDGDGKSDVRQVLFGGWNQRDTHGGPSNMNYGLDNWIWGMLGYNRSNLNAGGERTQFGQGFYRFKPDGSKVEFLRSTSNNTWGGGLSEEGIVFGSTANACPSVYMPIPNRYYEAVRGWSPSLVLRMMSDTMRFRPITDKVRQVDQFGGYTAAAGHALYTARTYPQEYWDRVGFVAEPTGHLVGAFVIREEGSDFKSNNSFNLFASDDEWTAPIMAEVGPDGNVWVIDWYNYIVQHNPTPRGFPTGRGQAYESDLRDKTHGRIYRVIYEKTGKTEDTGTKYSLAGATPEKLVATLANDNLFWRRHAQRLLVERGNKDVVPALVALARNQTVDAIGLNAGVTHALWTLHGLGALDGSNTDALSSAVAALKHPSAGVRRNAVQVLPPSEKSVAAILESGVLKDPSAQVRLLSLLALADQPATPAAAAAVALALVQPENARDRWIPDAATSAAAKNNETFLKSVTAVKQAQAAPVVNDKLLAVTAIVAEHYARGKPDDASLERVVVALGDADANVAAAIVQGLSKGWPTGAAPKLTDASEKAIAKLSTTLPPERRALLVKLATLLGSKSANQFGAAAAAALTAKAKDSAAKIEDRVAAASELVGYQPNDENAAKTLLDVITPQVPSELGIGILRAIQASESPAVGELIIARLPGMTPTVRSTGVATLLARPQWTQGLLTAMNAGKVQLTDLSLDQRQALADHPDQRVRQQAGMILRRGGALPSADREAVIKELFAVTETKGDAAAGKLVFKAQCAKCHQHSGEGEKIGPDLTGMGTHPKEELLVNILDPNRSVEANFRIYKVVTKNGVTIQGMLASESKTAVEVVDAEGKRSSILREDIDELVQSTKSLMPEGFEKSASKKDITDLLEFFIQTPPPKKE